MRCVLIILLFATPTYAGWFGPSNFNECIFENMKGVQSDRAATIIYKTCRKKFPETASAPATEKRTYFDEMVARDEFYVKLTKLSPAWETTNNDKGFKRYVANHKDRYGTPLSEVIIRHYNNFNAPAVSEIFNSYTGK